MTAKTTTSIAKAKSTTCHMGKASRRSGEWWRPRTADRLLAVVHGGAVDRIVQEEGEADDRTDNRQQQRLVQLAQDLDVVRQPGEDHGDGEEEDEFRRHVPARMEGRMIA